MWVSYIWNTLNCLWIIYILNWDLITGGQITWLMRKNLHLNWNILQLENCGLSENIHITINFRLYSC